MKRVVRTGWRAGRFVLNLPTTLIGCLIGLLSHGSCHWDSEHLVVLCTGSSAPKLGSTAFSVGSTIITSLSRQEFMDQCDGRLVAHETKHSDQWALLGPVGFLSAYGSEFVRSRVVARRQGGNPGSRNLFERWAILADGGYPPRPRRRHQ